MSAKIKLDFLATNPSIADGVGTANDFIMDNSKANPFIKYKDELLSIVDSTDEVEECIDYYYLRNDVEAGVKAGIIQYPKTKDEVFDLLFNVELGKLMHKLNKPNDTIKYYEVALSSFDDEDKIESFDTLEEAEHAAKDYQGINASIYEVETDFDSWEEKTLVA